MDKSFSNQKVNCLSKVDCSRKGVIDYPIYNLCQFINSNDRLFTTSSCSGRIILFEDEEKNGVKKKGCKWLFTTHSKMKSEEMKDALMNIMGEAVFKFEPFVMHIQCQELEDAQNLHSVAVSSGFRNSGISVGKKGKIIAAIRSCHGLEVPISCDGQILVSEQYINHIIEIANRKMEENENRIKRFSDNLKASLEASSSKNHKTSKRKKQQNKHKKDPSVSLNSTKTKTEESIIDPNLTDIFHHQDDLTS